MTTPVWLAHPTRDPSSSQGRPVDGLVTVFVGDGQLCEACVDQRRPDLRVGEEVLAVVLGERVAIAGPGDIDPRVARSCTAVYHAADHEMMTVRVAGHDWVGLGEVHHGFGVEVEDEPAADTESAGNGEERRPQLGWSEVVQSVEGGNRRVEDDIDGQVRKRLLDQDHPRAEKMPGAGQHHGGAVHTDDAIAECDELAGHQAGAAADVHYGAHTGLV